MSERLLPPGWVWTTIGEVADTTSGGTPLRKHPEYYGGTIPWVKSGELRDTFITSVDEFITEEGLINSSAKLFPHGTALVALYGATVGRTGILGLDAATNQAVCAIFPRQNTFTAKFITYWLQFQRQALIDLSVGGAQPNISQGIIKAFHLPLPPLPEQHRIVAEIEKQLTRLDAGVAALHRARANLRRYKAAVLKAACEGRLVPQDPADEPASVLLERILAERRARWEAEQIARGKDPKRLKYKEPVAPDREGLPERWVLTTMDAVADTVSGVAKGRNFQDRKTVTLPYLRVANVQQGYLDLDVVKNIEVLEEESERYRLQENDLLLTEGGDWDKLGRSAIWKDQIPNCIHQNHIFRARPYLSELSTLWLMYCTNSEQGRKYFARSAKQTTNLASINLTQLRACPIPLPPLAEQQRIVAEVERRLSVVEGLEASVEANLKRAERLRQAVLKRAFAGELVPQDPDDEPASVLLERIRAEREKRKKPGFSKKPGF